MILTKEGESTHNICTSEELTRIQEIMEQKSGCKEYVKLRTGKIIHETKSSIFDNLELADVELLRLSKYLSLQRFQSEPVKPMHLAIRILFHASHTLGRPYDINMMAYVFNTTSQVIQQAMKKWFKGLISQSDVIEEHFVPTYLWIIGLPQKGQARDRIVNAISKYGDPYDGRSVFSIARDYTVLYFRLFLGLPFSCVPKERPGIPQDFLKLLTILETRAKVSRRYILKRHPNLNNNILSIFTD